MTSSFPSERHRQSGGKKNYVNVETTVPSVTATHNPSVWSPSPYSLGHGFSLAVIIVASLAPHINAILVNTHFINHLKGINRYTHDSVVPGL